MSKNLPNTTEATRFIPLKEVTRRYGRSRWWVRDQIRAGRFPLPVMLNDRPAFVESEIEQHQQTLMAQRESELAG